MARGVFSALARGLWGSRGRRFKSCRPDFLFCLVFRHFLASGPSGWLGVFFVGASLGRASWFHEVSKNWKKGRPGFTQSESDLLLSALDRHDDSAVVVCLVGHGQEINTGEAGSKKWLESVREAFASWDVFISPHLTDSEYAATGALARLTESRAGAAATFEPALHLATSMRSFRAEVCWRLSNLGVPQV